MKAWKIGAAIFAAVLAAGFFMPERAAIPVQGASPKAWNHQSFWHEPWGVSGVHKGIDIFKPHNTPIVAATSGLVIYRGEFGNGGRVIAVMGPKWRVHYYAHLETAGVAFGSWVRSGEVIGTLGTSGNAAGRPPHLHYTVLSIVPLPWLITPQTQGWKRMFYLDPQQILGGTDVATLQIVEGF